MPTAIHAIVRRIDFEPKVDFLSVPGRRTWAHVFFRSRDGTEVDACTEDIALQIAVLAAWRPQVEADAAIIFPPLVEMQYEQDQSERRLIRVVLDYDMSRLG
jgi:hypothetical protein